MDEAEPIRAALSTGSIGTLAKSKMSANFLASEAAQHEDFASVIFLKILQKDFKAVDHNLHRWNRSLAVPVARQSIKLAWQYECATGVSVVASLADFAATLKSKSFALKASLLRSERR